MGQRDHRQKHRPPSHRIPSLLGFLDWLAKIAFFVEALLLLSFVEKISADS
jgi:hypothetical protein